MRGLLLALLLVSSTASAATYPKPEGVPEIYVPGTNAATITIAAVSVGFVGEGLAILTKQPDGNWGMCGQCMPAPTVNLQTAIDQYGSAEAWVASQVPFINERLAQLFPADGPQPPSPGGSATNQVNYTLFTSYKLELVNNVPVLVLK